MTGPAGSGGDLYGELGVGSAATPEELRRAYRRLARELHPDVNTDPAAQQRFRAVAAAYAVLSDPAQRAVHDRSLAETAAERDPDTYTTAPGPVDYRPAGPPTAYPDYVPTAPDGAAPPPPETTPRATGSGGAVAGHGVWPAAWPVGRIDPQRGVGPVLLAAFRIAPLPRTVAGKTLTVAGAPFVHWIAGPVLLSLLPPGSRPWAALMLVVLLWAALTCWTVRALAWSWITGTDAVRHVRARIRDSNGPGGRTSSGPRTGTER